MFVTNIPQIGKTEIKCFITTRLTSLTNFLFILNVRTKDFTINFATCTVRHRPLSLSSEHQRNYDNEFSVMKFINILDALLFSHYTI